MQLRRLVSIVILASALADTIRAEEVPENVLCGDIYWLKFTPPDGWHVGSERSPHSLETKSAVVVMSSGESEEMQRAISLQVDAATVTPATEWLDPERMLDEELNKLSLIGAVGQTRRAPVAHPSLPTAAVTLSTGRGSITLVQILAAAERGRRVWDQRRAELA